MTTTKAEKQDSVRVLVGQLKRAPTIYVTDFTGLNVKRMTELRRKLRAAGVEYVVVKNTLALRAFGEAQVTGAGGLEAHLSGPTALVLGGADPVAPAKVLTDFAKEHEKPAIRIGLVEGKTVTPAQVKQLAALPSRPWRASSVWRTGCCT
jgi:large subunit ribosomal protein L10